MPEAPKLLIIRRRGLGDALVSLDLVRALRERWPDARVSWVIDRAFAPLFEDLEGIDELWVYDARALREASLVQRLRLTSGWLRRLRAARFDLVLDLLGTPQTALWTRVSGAATRVGVERAWRTWGYNRLLRRESGEPRFAGDRVLDWARALEMDPGAWRPAALPQRGVRAELREPLESLRGGVLLNPSATWSAKAWPNESWARLASIVRAESGRRAGLVWGPGDEARRDAIARLAGDDVEILPPTSLVELVECLRAAALLITTDSGPKHLSVAAGTPTLTLFGSTNPLGWQPQLDGHVALHENELPCRPCDLLDCPLEGHPCMQALTPERVLDAAKSLRSEGENVV